MKGAHERGLMPSTGIGVGILASVLLALLTVSVFYVLRDYGPESAVRKYNEAVLQGDIVALNDISAQPITPSDKEQSERVAHLIGRLLVRGGRLRLDAMARDPTNGVAVAAVDYVLPDQPPFAFWFVVVKENHVWKVSPSQSAKAFTQKTRLSL